MPIGDADSAIVNETALRMESEALVVVGKGTVLWRNLVSYANELT